MFLFFLKIFFIDESETIFMNNNSNKKLRIISRDSTNGSIPPCVLCQYAINMKDQMVNDGIHIETVQPIDGTVNIIFDEKDIAECNTEYEFVRYIVAPELKKILDCDDAKVIETGAIKFLPTEIDQDKKYWNKPDQIYMNPLFIVNTGGKSISLEYLIGVPSLKLLKCIRAVFEAKFRKGNEILDEQLGQLLKYLYYLSLNRRDSRSIGMIYNEFQFILISFYNGKIIRFIQCHWATKGSYGLLTRFFCTTPNYGITDELTNAMNYFQTLFGVKIVSVLGVYNF